MSGRLPVADRATLLGDLRLLVTRERRSVAVTLLLFGLTSIAGLAAPWILGDLVNAVTTGAGPTTVDKLAALLVIAVVVQGLVARFAEYGAHRFGERTAARLREDFVANTVALPVSVVERAGTGDLATRSSVDVATVGSTLRYVLPVMVVASARILLILGAVFLLHPLLGLIGFTVLPPVLLASRWYLRRASDAYLAEGAAAAELTDALTTTAEGARTVEAFRLTEERIERGTELVGVQWRAKWRTLGLRSVFFPIVEGSYALPIGLVLLLGGYLLSRGMVNLGAVIAAALYLQQLSEPMDTLLQWLEQTQRGIASYARVLGVGLVPAEAAGVGAAPDGELLEVRGVKFAYGEGRDVLHGIDLRVRPGERLAIVGPSGAGKSTLARLLAGMEAPREGVVSLGGCPITDLEPARRRREIALVTQEHHVFIGTVRDNLVFAAPDATDDQMLAALDVVGADWFARLPDGLDAQLGSGALELSAADAQQLALARIVLADPHTLILDEATAALDPTTARRTERSLAAVLTGRTVIAVAHRLNTAHDADRVAVVDQGRVAELGSHDELVAAGGAYASLWRTWHG